MNPSPSRLNPVLPLSTFKFMSMIPRNLVTHSIIFLTVNFSVLYIKYDMSITVNTLSVTIAAALTPVIEQILQNCLK